MRFFTMLLDPEGRGMRDAVLRAHEAMPRRRSLDFAWQTFDHAALLTAWDDPYGAPLVARDGTWIAAGTVRLDNRDDLERWGSSDCRRLTDLELVLRVIARHGTRYIPQILGDFGFVVWDDTSGTAVAACDAFGTRPLYYAQNGGMTKWASRAEPLMTGDRYELRYLVELLTSYLPPVGLSVYAGVQKLPPASLAILKGATINVRTYWSPADFKIDPEWAGKEREAVDTCRQLLVQAVRRCMNVPAETWAQLSGGLDSSSVVSLALWLAERGEATGALSGTVTYVDREGTQTDERRYSGAVAERFKVRNEAIIEPPLWYDEASAPVAADQPGLDLHVQPRERRLCRLVREAGGRVLLTGYGGDELFTNNLLYCADWVAEGRVWLALRQMTRLATIGRQSFWDLAYRNALVPLLPAAVQSRLVNDASPPESWLEAAALRKYLCRQGAVVRQQSAGRLGQKYHHAVVAGVQALQGIVHGGILSDALELRHPLLYRPLVEFALSLPHSIRSRPDAHRWILREAMRGILPDVVRTRTGKPDTSDVLLWSFAANHNQLRRLLERPILADFGLIDPKRLRAAFEGAAAPTRQRLKRHIGLYPTLAIEAWLRIRSGRWPH